MGRKGDIISKVIGVRAPIKTYTKLLNDASDKGVSLSEYCVSLLSNQDGNFGVDYKRKWEELRELNYQLENLIEQMKIDHKNQINGWVDCVKDNHKEIDMLKRKYEN